MVPFPLTFINNLSQITYPVWLNADILPGPVKATTKPVDPVKFLTLGAKHPRTVLSIGWTTSYGGNVTEGEYSRDQIGTMLRMINEYHINQTVTFPVSTAMSTRHTRLYCLDQYFYSPSTSHVIDQHVVIKELAA